MRSSISGISSYLFMASIIALAISTFALIVIISRHFFGDISNNEIVIGYKFLTIFIISAIIAPITLYINLKFDRIEKLKDEESF